MTGSTPGSGAEVVPDIRVVIVDDQALARSGLRSIVENEPGMTVVGEATNGEEGIELVARTAPDIAVMDLRMPVLDGIEAIGRIVASAAGTQILVLTTFDDEELVYKALEAGAAGFLLKDASPDQMIAAIRTVHRGHSILSPEVTRTVIARYTAATAPAVNVDPAPGLLTDRERQILALVAQGLSNREIGLRLFVSEGTAKTHVSNILAKTGRYSRAQLVALAYEAGFMKPSAR